jgi:hypothetical protein
VATSDGTSGFVDCRQVLGAGRLIFVICRGVSFVGFVPTVVSLVGLFLLVMVRPFSKRFPCPDVESLAR